MKVALVHDYLNEFGGAERVLLALSEIYPDAPIYTAFYQEGSSAYKRFKGKKIITSWAQNVPFFASKLHSPLRFLAPFIWNSFVHQLADYDVVIGSSSWYVTKGFKRIKSIKGNKSFVEICYCHTPPRYLYGYPTASNLQKHFLVRVYALLVNHFMRVYDFEAAQRVDWFIANSKEVAGRVKKFYRRESTVIYPPVDVKKFTVNSSQLIVNKNTMNHEPSTNYFLVVSRLVAAKNVDIAVEVCTNLKLPLKIVGTGKEMQALKELASSQSSVNGEQSTIEFLGDVSDSELVELYQNCRSLIFSGSQEDFGIVPVEAMAAGKPVIALAEGGIKETVIDGKTGLWVEDLAPGAFVIAINKFLEMEKKGQWDSEFIRKHAQKFSKERFKREIKKFVESKHKKA
ncbi:MAG: glycosyltransferase [Patescibacteria group bacterium]